VEAIKAKIEAIKIFFIIVTTSLFSIIAYLFLHFSFLSTYVLVYGIIVSIAIDIILLIFWIKLIKKLGEFDE